MVKCDKCDKEAVANYQKVWKRFIIDEKEDYIEDNALASFDPLDIEEPTGDNNLHFCKEHEKEFLK